ncbi:alpha/beta hydrolase family protein [Phenylobacterium sp.]|uniref:alpha/beta hydrolase family protein n=1 Tax=Phenylobacterium sp. TaxID=1871053 RepID=UPI0035AE58DE
MRSLLRIAAACLMAAASSASAALLSVDDLLQLEDLGAVTIDPRGRWLVAEARAPYAEAGSFQGDYYGRWATSRLYRVDLAAPGPAAPLLDGAHGLLAGPVSPDGARMVVYRLSPGRWQAGIFDLASDRVRWLAGTPDYSVLGRTAQWRSPDELIAIRLPGEDLPTRLRLGWSAMAELPELWRAADRGEAAVSVAGSGAFASLRPGPPPSELVSLDVRRGTERVLARGPFVDLELSPDGRYLALLSAGELVAPPPDRPLRGGETLQRHALQVLDLASGALAAPCPACDVLPGLLAWSPARASLLIYARAPGQAWTAGRLRRIDGARPARPLPAGDVTPAVSLAADGTVSVQAGWLAARPLLLGRRPGAARDDWFVLDAAPRNLTAALPSPIRLVSSTRRGARLAAAGEVWSLSSAGDLARDAPPGAWTLAEPPEPSLRLRLSAGDRDWAAAQPAAPAAGRPERLARIGPGGLRLSPAPPQAQLLAVGETAAAYLTRDAHGVSQLWVQAGNAAPAPVLTLNAPLAARAPAQVRRLQGPAGQPPHWLYLPPAWRPGTRLAMVVIPYPGAVYDRPPAKYAPGALTFYTNPQLLAAQGYAVLVPSLPRPRGREPMDGLADQVLAAVDLAIGDGYADPERLAVWGHSFGGYAAMALATQTGRFRSIIASAGISDLTSHWGAIPPDFAVSPQLGPSINWGQGWVEQNAGMDGPPWTAPERYARNSPLSHAAAIQTPMLLIQGDQDSIALGQAQSLFSALYRQGKPAVLVTYWGEGHVVTSPGNVRDMYQRVFAWLAATLPPPAASPGPAAAGSRPASRLRARRRAAAGRRRPTR